jgi:hypothetical protein
MWERLCDDLLRHVGGFLYVHEMVPLMQAATGSHTILAGRVCEGVTHATFDTLNQERVLQLSQRCRRLAHVKLRLHLPNYLLTYAMLQAVQDLVGIIKTLGLHITGGSGEYVCTSYITYWLECAKKNHSHRPCSSLRHLYVKVVGVSSAYIGLLRDVVTYWVERSPHLSTMSMYGLTLRCATATQPLWDVLAPRCRVLQTDDRHFVSYQDKRTWPRLEMLVLDKEQKDVGIENATLFPVLRYLAVAQTRSLNVYNKQLDDDDREESTLGCEWTRFPFAWCSVLSRLRVLVSGYEYTDVDMSKLAGKAPNLTTLVIRYLTNWESNVPQVTSLFPCLETLIVYELDVDNVERLCSVWRLPVTCHVEYVLGEFTKEKEEENNTCRLMVPPLHKLGQEVSWNDLKAREVMRYAQNQQLELACFGE